MNTDKRKTKRSNLAALGIEMEIEINDMEQTLTNNINLEFMEQYRKGKDLH
jgi:hypothetical protein